ncbi:MAG TPA: sulfur carrier protein ThiS [Planctomycetota bacterium]|nr:sulfur carrier protein ThiS [Planctomycetota bacterium]
MNIVLNGERRAFDAGTTAADLLKDLELEGKPVALERNGETVQKSKLNSTELSEGDRIEIVTFVGGG